MNCNEVYEKLELLMDGELPEQEKQRILDHIYSCTNCNCKDLYEAERCFKEYLQKALFPKQVPQQVIDDVRSYAVQVK